MKETKRRFETFSIYDRTGIAEHFEKMAAKGWMIERMGNFGWVYRRSEPRALRFAVTYYPKTSEFDPEPTKGQLELQEFCAHTGWTFVCSSGQLQVFYNEQADPTPIETDPVVEVETIHATMKKSYLPVYALWLLICVMNGGLWAAGMIRDPLDQLSRSSGMFPGLAYLLMVVLLSLDIFRYFRWHRRAKKAAERGEFLSTPGTGKIWSVFLALVLLGILVWMLRYLFLGNRIQQWIGFAVCVYVPLFILLVLAVNGTKQFLKRKKASRGVNRVLTFATSFVLAFMFLGILGFATFRAVSGGLFSEKGEGSYEYNGIVWEISNDELPLSVEDLRSIDPAAYTKERREQGTLLLSKAVMSQRPRFDAVDYRSLPWLSYKVLDVKWSALCDFCREELFKDGERPLEGVRYVPQEAVAWGAKEAYRLYDEGTGTFRNQYLLCYGGRFLEIQFSWEPDEDEMRIVGEKFAR